MLTDIQIHQALDNLDLLIANANISATWFSLSNNQLSKNRLFKAKPKKTQQLRSYLQHLIDEVSSNNIEHNNRSYGRLFISLQYFLHLQPNQIIKDLPLDLTNSKYLQRKELHLKHLRHSHPQNQFKNNLRENKLPKINYDPRTGHYTSPDDNKAHQHGSEAKRIFLATQIERLKGFCNWLFAKIGIYVFETARYKEHAYLNSDIYTHTLPIEPKINAQQTANHYWIGHASNLITIPTISTPLHVLTDPVEGDLAPLFYPRMTEEASLVDGRGDKRLPKIDVVIISHNHRDHVSEATLKRLLKQQPKMIVPEGDEALFINLGFTHVIGLKWWEQATVEDNEGNELLRLTAVPARHWSGRSLNDAHCSAFNGYVLHSKQLEGDIYFAGDTALMDDIVSQPIFDQFNIITSIQPGGPDERRAEMESTHQSSADAILMHFKILATQYKKMKAVKDSFSFSEFLEKTQAIKTIYNHTATFKLGNLRLKDTFYSYQRIIAAFHENAQWRADHLPQHEQNVYDRIQALVKDLVFEDGTMDNKQIVAQILGAIAIPKIGQRQPLYFTEEARVPQLFQHRHLITNRRALTEFDSLLQNSLSVKQEDFSAKTIILKLLDTYHNPWHAFFSRTYQSYNRRELEACQSNHDLLIVLNRMEINMGKRNQHGHMQSLIHYAKWVINFSNQHQNKILPKFKEYFACQRIRTLVDQEIHHQGWGHGRSAKQQSFRTLSDQLADLPAEQDQYQHAVYSWLNAKATVQQSNYQFLSTHRSLFFAGEVPRSKETVKKITELLAMQPRAYQ